MLVLNRCSGSAAQVNEAPWSSVGTFWLAAGDALCRRSRDARALLVELAVAAEEPELEHAAPVAIQVRPPTP